MDDTKLVRLYVDCSELPILNFHKMGKVLDLTYLAKTNDYDEVDFLPISAKKVWDDIYNEYCEILNSPESKKHLQNVGELDELDKKYQFSCALMEVMLSIENKEDIKPYFKEISAWGFAFNQSKPFAELKRFNVWLKSIKSRINVLISEIDSIRKKQISTVRLEKQQVKLERATGRSNIDLKTCSVAKWLEIIKDAEEIATQRNKKANHGNR